MIRTFLLSVVFFYVSIALAAPEVPLVNVPKNLRETNFQGNCVHASFVNLLRWQGRYDWASWWIENHGGGEFPWTMKQKLDASGIDYAMTVGKNDVAFLEKSVVVRRGCTVAVHNGPLYGYPRIKTRRNPTGEIYHMVCLVHMDKKVVGLIDNNHGNRMFYVSREAFLLDWSETSWAISPLMGTPAPPQLWREHEK